MTFSMSPLKVFPCFFLKIFANLACFTRGHSGNSHKRVGETTPQFLHTKHQGLTLLAFSSTLLNAELRFTIPNSFELLVVGEDQLHSRGG